MHRTAVAVLWLVALCSSRLPAQAGRSNTTAPAPAPGSLAERVQQVIDRPEYRRSSFGVAFYGLDANTPLFTRNAHKLFAPGSTPKLVTEGTGLELLGPDYRFHTRIYRTGPIRKDGTLAGDLVLVASGDPNLSGRIRPDGTLAFENQDHAYDGSPDTRAVPGDPLLVIHELADQIAARHIQRVAGRGTIDNRRCVRGAGSPAGVRHDFKALAAAYTGDNLVAAHVSPPLTEEAKVTLKVSQNLHASMMPFILGGVLAHDGTARAGFRLEHDLLERAGLDLSGASQGDGAGGAAHFAPEFMVRF